MPMIKPLPTVGLIVMEDERRKKRARPMKKSPRMIFSTLWSTERDTKVKKIVETTMGGIRGHITFHLIFLHLPATTRIVRRRQEIWL